MIDLTSGKLPRGNCAYCGKIIPIKDIRDKKARFCNRTHAAMARFSTRYRGSGSGPSDRKDISRKLDEL